MTISNVTQPLQSTNDAALPLTRPHPLRAYTAESTTSPPITQPQRQHRKTSGTDGRRPSVNDEHRDWFRYISDDSTIDDVEQNDQPVELHPVYFDENGDEESDVNNFDLNRSEDSYANNDDQLNDDDKSNGGNKHDVDERKRSKKKRSRGLEYMDRSKPSKSAGNSASHRVHDDGLRHGKGKHSKIVDSDDEYEDISEDFDLDSSSTSPCDRLHCSGSAQCVVDYAGDSKGQWPTARCRCPLGTTGLYCERGTIFT